MSRLGQGSRRVLICGLAVGFVAVLLVASLADYIDPGQWIPDEMRETELGRLAGKEPARCAAEFLYGRTPINP